MDSRELAAVMAKAAGIDLKLAQKALAAIAPTVTAQLKKGGAVRLGSLGTFKRHKQPARSYKSTKTHQIVNVPQKFTVKFTVARGKKAL